MNIYKAFSILLILVFGTFHSDIEAMLQEVQVGETKIRKILFEPGTIEKKLLALSEHRDVAITLMGNVLNEEDWPYRFTDIYIKLDEDKAIESMKRYLERSFSATSGTKECQIIETLFKNGVPVNGDLLVEILNKPQSSEIIPPFESAGTMEICAAIPQLEILLQAAGLLALTGSPDSKQEAADFLFSHYKTLAKHYNEQLSRQIACALARASADERLTEAASEYLFPFLPGVSSAALDGFADTMKAECFSPEQKTLAFLKICEAMKGHLDDGLTMGDRLLFDAIDLALLYGDTGSEILECMATRMDEYFNDCKCRIRRVREKGYLDSISYCEKKCLVIREQKERLENRIADLRKK